MLTRQVLKTRVFIVYRLKSDLVGCLQGQGHVL